jgi:hypothetical protein
LHIGRGTWAAPVSAFDAFAERSSDVPLYGNLIAYEVHQALAVQHCDCNLLPNFKTSCINMRLDEYKKW